MKDEEKYKPVKKVDPEPFGPIMRQMNDFFTQQPTRRLLDSINEFFEKPPLFLSTIPIDMYETDDELIISADLPGVKREQINIEYAENHITITVNHSEQIEESNEKKHYYVKKHSYNKASRTVTLPYPIINRNAKASYRDGVLTIRVPKQKKKRLTIDE